MRFRPLELIPFFVVVVLEEGDRWKEGSQALVLFSFCPRNEVTAPVLSTGSSRSTCPGATENMAK